jgi:hypothetical protein
LNRDKGETLLLTLLPFLISAIFSLKFQSLLHHPYQHWPKTVCQNLRPTPSINSNVSADGASRFAKIAGYAA